MLGKLLKYEFKATARTFIPLYIGIILVSLFNGLFLNPNDVELSNAKVIGIIILVALFIALVVITIVVTVQRFSKNLLGDEGYLMFTLPVSTKMLILSKTLIATLWSVLSGVVAIVSFGLIGTLMIGKVTEDILNLGEIISLIQTNLSPDQISNMAFTIFNISIFFILSYITFILTIYLAISIGQLNIFCKHKTATAFVVFIILNIIQSEVLSLIGLDEFMTSTWHRTVIIGNLSSIVIGVILFFATSYILEKKINLE
ncbi:MAG: ABC transporter permease [Clostridium sp.]